MLLVLMVVINKCWKMSILFYFLEIVVSHKCVCHLYLVLRTVTWFSILMACLLTYSYFSPVTRLHQYKYILCIYIYTHVHIYDYTHTVEPGCNDIGLCDTSYVTSYTLWYQLILHC